MKKRHLPSVPRGCGSGGLPLVRVAQLPPGVGKRENDNLSDCESGESGRHKDDASHARLRTTAKSRKQKYRRYNLDPSRNS